MMQQEKSDDYIIASGKEVTLKQLARDISYKFGIEIPELTCLSNKPVFKTIGDPTKLKNIGWKPKYDIDKLIEDLIYNENIH
jgi:GDP-D-mannose dehydratase